jgi:hypothetical protein
MTNGKTITSDKATFEMVGHKLLNTVASAVEVMRCRPK